ncbi:apolipoprotein L domain-containing protein 1-like [Sinocyclocheilus anshuiensis]|uniref:apolipoprotein L domain-containing protein 1-like n=1 Tax=Sinocyclocheilus anshuiensis TaxID=1608454 RepID=UPI0007BA231E|nr:PREDICTED: apolipoprotein L domain-containing protein 1-like [Sinocyclocheilus anshuiensis]
MDQHTRLTFIFQEHAQRFIGVFSQRRSRMEQFLSDLEESAVQLDRMKMGASISTVAGSSVGIAGGVLSIVGLALAPVTAGVSLVLTLTGVGLGVTSGVNSVVTGITEAVVNSQQGKNAQNIFQRYMDDVGKILDCLEQASSREPDVKGLAGVDIITAGKLVFRAIGLCSNIGSLVDKALQIEEGIVTAIKISLNNAKSEHNITKHTAKMHGQNWAADKREATSALKVC